MPFDMINLIIPTFNRHLHLKRMLSFFQRYYLNEMEFYNIYILDSSSNAVSDPELRKIINELDIKYLKFDKDLFVVQKIQSITNLLDENYTLMLADDDIIDLKRFLYYRKFLEQNKDYSCVNGIVLFDDFKHDLYFKNLKKTVKDYSISSDNYKKRIEQYSLLSNIGNSFYGLIRTELFKIIWNQMSEFVFFWYYPEILFNYSLLLSGKFAVFENITSIRNLNEKLFNDTNSLSIMNTERNMRALDLFRLIKKDCDTDFMLKQLDIIKIVQKKIIEKKPNNKQLKFHVKEYIKKILYSVIDKGRFYDTVDTESIMFHKRVLNFYKDNHLSNYDIAHSREMYEKWM